MRCAVQLAISAALTLAPIGGVAAGRAAAQGAFADPRVVVEFQRAADAYAFSHRQVERRVGMAHRRAGAPVEVIDAKELAAGIVAERPRPPALFTPPVVAAFRDAAQRVLRAGCDPGELRTGAAASSYTPYAPATGSSGVAGCLRSALPGLPEELEYRSAGTTLLIVDPQANLVIDVLPGLIAGGGIP